MVSGSKAEIASKFGLTILGIDDLIDRELVTPKISSKFGKSVYTFPDEDTLVLELARNTPLNFYSKKTPIFPFQRFLYLRFLTTTPEIIIEELIQSGRLGRKSSEAISAINDSDSKFKDNLPDSIKRVLSDPDNACEKDIKDLYTLVKILDIETYFNDPGVLDLMIERTFGEWRDDFEAVISTSGTIEEISDFLTEYMECTFSTQELEAYRHVFYDTKIMNEASLNFYFKTIPPSNRSKKAVIGKDLTQLKVEYCIFKDKSDDDAMLKKAQMISSATYLDNMRIGTIESITQASKALNMLLRTISARDKMSFEKSSLQEFFERLEVKPDYNLKIETANEFTISAKDTGS